MKKAFLLSSAILLAISSVFGQDNSKADEALTNKIIAIERAALEEWNKGNPDAYLIIYATDYTYFDPYLEKRVDGFDAIKKLYDGIKGQVSVDHYEMIDPMVQILAKDVAVLTFNLYSYSGNEVYKWNCTEVFNLQPDKAWKIIHTHWSYIRPIGQ